MDESRLGKSTTSSTGDRRLGARNNAATTLCHAREREHVAWHLLRPRSARVLRGAERRERLLLVILRCARGSAGQIDLKDGSMSDAGQGRQPAVMIFDNRPANP